MILILIIIEIISKGFREEEAKKIIARDKIRYFHKWKGSQYFPFKDGDSKRNGIRCSYRADR